MKTATSPVATAADQARAWCRNNPGWQPICDLKSTDHLYIGWEDLTKSQKLSWRMRWGDSAPAIFDYQANTCKVPTGWVDERGQFTDDVPFGTVGMMVFRTGDLKP